jgi:hypothetical protein
VNRKDCNAMREPFAPFPLDAAPHAINWCEIPQPGGFRNRTLRSSRRHRGRGHARGATIMTTHTVKASNTNDLARAPSTTRANDPTPLTQTDLDAVAAGGGGAGINPSRGNPRA